MATYHPGELTVQRRAGATDVARRVARSIQPTIPPVAQAFLAEQPLLFASARDDSGRVWADVLHGPPGFARAVDEQTVRIDALPGPEAPLREVLQARERHVGLLAVEPATRRRMRINGTAWRHDDGLSVLVGEAYSNCPKYLQRRRLVARAAAGPPAPARRGTSLTDADRSRIAAADTFVIATAHPDGPADVSHRGGSPGFVHVLDERTLAFGDYRGNSMFNTLGNLEADPRAGLLVLDWARGDALHVSGRGRVDWDPARAARFPGAERVVELSVERIVAIDRATPLRFSLVEPSPFNPPAT